MATLGDPRLPERIWAKISVSEGGCWEWMGYRKALGYGKAAWGKGPDYVHRITYQTLVSAVPQGKELHHMCENPPCCNPDHLLPVTRREHRQFSLMTHCAKGHPLEGENVILEGGSVRRCRSCREAWAASRRVRPPGKANAELSAKDVCLRGHRLFGDNVYVRPNGTRRCEECRRARQRKYAAKRKSDRGAVR